MPTPDNINAWAGYVLRESAVDLPPVFECLNALRTIAEQHGPIDAKTLGSMALAIRDETWTDEDE